MFGSNDPRGHGGSPPAPHTSHGPYGAPQASYAPQPSYPPQQVPYGVAQPYGYGYAPQAYAHHAHAAAGSCHGCGAVGPTKRVSIMYNVGALVIRFHKTASGELCKRCISDYFWKYTLITLFFGWWGVISFFVSLVAIPMNVAYYLASLGMSEPSDSPHDAPIRAGLPGHKIALIVLGALLGFAALLSTLLGVAMMFDPEALGAGVVWTLLSLAFLGAPSGLMLFFGVRKPRRAAVG